MGPRELATRIRQSASARRDEWRFRLGLAPLQPARRSGGPRGRFFFDPSDAPSLARGWAERSPEAVRNLLAYAAKIAGRRFPLLGYPDLDFGNPIDWHLDPVHGVRAPLVAWRRVPFLDFHAVGDHKIVWELSRHQHLAALVRASLYSGEARWAEEAAAQWRAWNRANPYPAGIHWSSSLEAAFRVLSWTWMEHLLGASAAFSDFRAELVAAIGHGAWFIERHLSTYFAPNTHLLGEGVALLFAGTLYGEYRDAARWQETGWKIVLEQARAQVRDDGFHFEQSVYYHVYALDFLLHARALGARNGLTSKDLDGSIERMAAALMAISQTGAVPRFGDDDGGRVFDPTRNRDSCLLDPLVSAAATLGRAEFAAAGLTEEAWWLAGPEAARRFDSWEHTPAPLRSCAFPASGYYVMAGPASILVADGGPHGWARAAHGHADALSVQILADGHRLLSDPGTGAYPEELPIRNRLRSTAAHSTLEIDGRSQADPAGSFAWSNPPVSVVERWHAGRSIDLWRASHDGYRRLPDPIVHRRWIAGWKAAGWLVCDLAVSGSGAPQQKGSQAHRFDLRWHLDPSASLADENGSRFVFRFPSDLSLTLAAADDSGWSAKLEEGEYSPAYGAVVPAPVLRWSAEGFAPHEIATVLAPGPAGPTTRLRRLHADAASSLYEWSDAAGIRFGWFARQEGVKEALGWRTDAEFAFAALDAAGALACLAISGATFFETALGAVFRSESRIDFAELPPDGAGQVPLVYDPAKWTPPRTP